jgi:hypothetical protein
MDLMVVKNRLAKLIQIKSQNDDRIIHLDKQARILRTRLQIDNSQ